MCCQPTRKGNNEHRVGDRGLKIQVAQEDKAFTVEQFVCGNTGNIFLFLPLPTL